MNETFSTEAESYLKDVFEFQGRPEEMSEILYKAIQENAQDGYPLDQEVIDTVDRSRNE